MTVQTALLAISMGCYVGASLAAVWALVRRPAVGDRATLIAVSFGGAALTVVLVARGVSAGRFPAFGFFEAISWYVLATTFAFVYVSLRHQMRGVSALLVPLVTILLAGSLRSVAAAVEVDSDLSTIWLGLHVVTAFIGYGLFTLEGVLAAVYLVQDRNLKRKHFGRLFHGLPSLEGLDRLMYSLVGFAFLMFSVSIGLGILLAHMYRWGTIWLTDPKVAATAATWVVYAILFHLRLGADRHGRKVAIVALIGLALVLFTFVGVHLATESLHNYVFPE